MDQTLLRELRLTTGEARSLRTAAPMLQDLRNKIVQNFVKLTQFVTEDPHRKAPMQNIPVLSAIVDYNNYAIGTGKYVFRRVADLGKAVASGSPRRIWGALLRAWTLLVTAGVAGILSTMGKRVSQGDEPIKDDETLLNMFGDGLRDSAILGPTQRMLDAEKFSYGDSSRMLIGLSPKAAFVRDFLDGVRGVGKMKDEPFLVRMREALKKNTPIWKRTEKLFESFDKK